MLVCTHRPVNLRGLLTLAKPIRSNQGLALPFAKGDRMAARPTRRKLRFRHPGEILEEAQRLADVGYEPLGNWSLGQVCGHLASTIDGSLDGYAERLPWIFRATAGRVMKWWILRYGMPSGVPLRGKSAEQLLPPPQTDAEGLAELERALTRLDEEECRAIHPALGSLNHNQWLDLHCRHGELHLSFLEPAETCQSDRPPTGASESQSPAES